MMNADEKKPGSHSESHINVTVRAALDGFHARVKQSGDLGFFLYLGALLGLFLIIEWLLQKALQLPATSYQQYWLLPEVFKQYNIFLIAAALAALTLPGWYRRLFCGWSSFDTGGNLRIYVMLLGLLLVWPLTTYGYNDYYDQSHWLDRSILLLVFILQWWRPVFVIPFTLHCYVLLGQLVEPGLGGSILAHKFQVTQVINLFAAFFILHVASGERRSDYFVYLSICLVAAAYWVAGLAKWDLNWHAHEQLHFLPLAAYAHGWLAFLEPSEIVAFALGIKPFGWVAGVMVLIVETAFLLVLLHRRVALVLLVSIIFFHLGVFALYGFLFWTWIGVAIALGLLLIRSRQEVSTQVFGGVKFIVSMLLVGFSIYWAKPPQLAWFDTPLSYTYRVHAVLDDGSEKYLHPRFFAPYEDVFTMNSFSYLSPDRAVLTATYGVTANLPIYERLIAAKSVKDIYAIESDIGANRSNPQRAERFYNFLTTYVENRNRNGDLLSGLYSMHSPLQFWSQRPGIIRLESQRIAEIIVVEVTSFFDGATLQIIREKELKRLPIQDRVQL